MTNNPLVNALAGLLYIVVVVLGLFNAQYLGIQEPNVFIPMAMLSLLVFSASLMGYLFLYQPLQLFLDGKKREGVDLFLKTLGIFGLSAVILFSVGLYLQAHL